MATHQAIAATGQAILGVLSEAVATSEFAGADFQLYQASDFKDPMQEGISLYLYRLSVSPLHSNRRARLDEEGQRFRPSLPLDLSYLLTAWARTAARQQRLLGWAVRTLDDSPILPPGLLNHFGPEPDVFGPNEAVELSAESLSLQDLVNIWDPFKPTTQLSMAYLARMVLIDSSVPLPTSSLLQTRVFEVVGAQA